MIKTHFFFNSGGTKQARLLVLGTFSPGTRLFVSKANRAARYRMGDSLKVVWAEFAN